MIGCFALFITVFAVMAWIVPDHSGHPDRKLAGWLAVIAKFLWIFTSLVVGLFSTAWGAPPAVRIPGVMLESPQPAPVYAPSLGYSFVILPAAPQFFQASAQQGFFQGSQQSFSPSARRYSGDYNSQLFWRADRKIAGITK
jgi:hypothetical protein